MEHHHNKLEDAEGFPLKSSSPASLFRAKVSHIYRRWRNKPVRFILLFFAVTTLLWIIIYLNSRRWTGSTTIKEHFKRANLLMPIENPSNQTRQGKATCPLPKLDPFGPQIMKLIKRGKFGKDLDCSGDRNLGIYKKAAFHVEEGNILVRDLKFPPDVKCSFKDATAVKNFEDEGEPLEIDLDAKNTAIKLPTEVVMVICKNSRGKVYYKDAFQMVQEKPEVEERIQNWEDAQLQLKLANRLSVLIIGMETTSQMQFERALPQTKRYLDEALSAVRIMGYNKVGDNTISNWIPLFTGMSFEEFPKPCVEQQNNRVLPANECPFIWNTFSSQGYRTSYAEDDMSLPGFDLTYSNPFQIKAPTDYYWRPFYVTMSGTLGFNGHCFGPRMAMECLTDMVKSMADMFKSNSTNKRHRPYFSFVWSGKLSHNTFDTHPWADKPLLEVLQYLHDNGHLNHTAVFLLGDHGLRNRDDVEQSMIENRMPLAYVVLPPWFQQRYSRAFQNLLWNAENSITSTYDMHKTILDMLDLERFQGESYDKVWRENSHFRPIKPEMSRRGQSLFEMSTKVRNCESAGIPWMWCLCMKKIPLRNDSFLAVNASQAAIDSVNRRMEQHSALCETLHLGHVVSATLLMLNDITEISAECRFIIVNANSTKNLFNAGSSSCKDEVLIEIKFVGTPHDPVYKTVAVFNPSTGNLSAPYEMRREDWYSTKGHCVRNLLRQYCICKVMRFSLSDLTFSVLNIFILLIFLSTALLCCFCSR